MRLRNRNYMAFQIDPVVTRHESHIARPRKKLQGASEMIRIPDVIGIKQCNPITGGGLDARIAGCSGVIETHA